MPLRFSASVLTTAPATARVVVTDNLVFNMNASTYPGSGTIWNNSVNATSATLTGSPTYNATTGFTFDGTSQYGRITSTASVTDFNNTDNYTVEIWFNPSSGQASGSLATVLEKWNSTNQSRYPYVFRYAEGTGVLSMAVYDGTNNPTATISGFNTGSWHQAVGVFNFSSGTTTPYRNGIAGSTTSLSGVGAVSNTSLVGIAHRISSVGAAQFLFKGSVGLIRIYDRALSAAEVLQNYNADESTYGV